MVNSDNVFSDMVGDDEKAFTKLLHNFLRFKILRKLLLNLLKTSGFHKSRVKYEHLKINDNNGEYGNFDLVIKNDEVEIIFEIKIKNTTLTNNQPLGYLEYLAKESKKPFRGLVLMAPKDYIYENDYNSQVSSFKKRSGIDIFTPTIYWNQLIESFNKEELVDTSTLFNEYYKFLNNFFGIIETTNINYNDIKNLFNKEIAEIIIKPMDIMYHVKEELYERGYNIKQEDTTGRYYKDSHHEYGFYIRNSNERWILFFGIWFDFWKKYNKPLCVVLTNDVSNDEWKPLEAKFIKLCKQKNLDVKYIHGEPITYIEENMIMYENNHEEIANLIEEFCIELELYPLSSNRQISKLLAED
jgi:hypothetical protein